MIHIQQAVIVEGKYDKIKLSSIIDAIILETDGFRIFKDRERLDLIKRLAETRGVLILTDSDAAGFKIRSYLKSVLPKEQVVHAYIPDLFGKESRKAEPSKEGKLGVEGIPAGVILESLKKAGVVCCEREEQTRKITGADLYEDGLSGGQGSAGKRRRFLELLHLPARLSSGSMLEVLNAVVGYDEYKKLVAELESRENSIG